MRPSRPAYVPAHAHYEPPVFNDAQEAGPGAWWWIRVILTILVSAVLVIGFALVMSSVMGPSPAERANFVTPSPYGYPPEPAVR
jgi:hypothetical protein